MAPICLKEGRGGHFGGMWTLSPLASGSLGHLGSKGRERERDLLCWKQERERAKSVAASLRVPFLVYVDFGSRA